MPWCKGSEIAFLYTVDDDASREARTLMKLAFNRKDKNLSCGSGTSLIIGWVSKILGGSIQI